MTEAVLVGHKAYEVLFAVVLYLFYVIGCERRFICISAKVGIGIDGCVNVQLELVVFRQWGPEPTLVSHSNFPRNGSKSLENTTVFPA